MIEPFGFIAAGSAVNKCLQPLLRVNPGPKATQTRCSGITQACGTGACACAVAACLAGLSEADREIAGDLPGGRLWITLAADSAQVQMRGPAVEAFRGRVILDFL
ncbi:MAG: hypothetical protein IIC41_07120 [Candidatus Marinimicrobia bacterium]|nr:hypothetical protein [Candidatus Neomarinimicrobiota bacterium]